MGHCGSLWLEMPNIILILYCLIYEIKIQMSTNYIYQLILTVILIWKLTLLCFSFLWQKLYCQRIRIPNRKRMVLGNSKIGHKQIRRPFNWIYMGGGWLLYLFVFQLYYQTYFHWKRLLCRRKHFWVKYRIEPTYCF